ncbi:MAG: tRNA dihydrouridine synthase DusB [bacterium]
MQIGPIKLRNPVVMAPLAGITNYAARHFAYRMGVALAFTEMISSEGLVRRDRGSFRLLDIGPEENPIGIQIYGNDPGAIAEAARIVALQSSSNGGRSERILDINMGCPSRKVVRGGWGAALMRNPELAGRIVQAAVEATSLPVTVKIRAGWDSGEINAVQIALIAQDKGASAVTVHGRTRSQGYGGTADWSIIKSVKDSVKIPVIGNGGIFSPQNAKRMIDETGCDGVMVARGAWGNPFLIREIIHYLETGELMPPPTFEERIATLVEHCEMLAGLVGERSAILQIRKFVPRYTRSMPGAARVRQIVNSIATLADFRDLMKEFLFYLSSVGAVGYTCKEDEKGMGSTY